MEPGHLLYSALTRPPGAAARRLKSRHPFVPAAQQIISFSDNNNIRAAQWADHQWNEEWADNPTRLRTSIPDTWYTHTGMTLPRRTWVRLNYLRTGVGRFRSCLYNPSTPHGLHGLTVLDDETTEWLLNTCPIYLGGLDKRIKTKNSVTCPDILAS